MYYFKSHHGMGYFQYCIGSTCKDHKCAYKSRLRRHLGLIHVRKVSSQIRLSSLHRVIRDDTFRFNGFFRLKESLLSKNPESVVHGKSVRTAQESLERHFTHTIQTPFSQREAHLNYAEFIKINVVIILHFVFTLF